MRASRLFVVGILGLICSAGSCGADFPDDFTVTCPAPIQVGQTAMITGDFVSPDPFELEWTAGVAGTFETTPQPLGATDDEFTRATFSNTFTPSAPGDAATNFSVRISIAREGAVKAFCELEVRPADAITHTLTITANGMGTVTSNPAGIDCPGTCSGDFFEDAQVTLTGVAAAGWRLDTVTGDCATSGSDYVATMDQARSCTFDFVNATMPSDQVQIPPGSFTRGCTDAGNCPGFEQPSNTVTLSAGYGIDKYEVTVAQYRACVDAGACTVPLDFDPQAEFPCNWGAPGRDNHPMNCVRWPQARAYCQWLGMDLPTEAQWERAARGDDDARAYPWGDEDPDCTRGNGTQLVPFMRCMRAGTSSVAQYPSGASPFGVEDMIGNVEEWVLDYYGAAYYAEASSQVDPTGPAMGTQRVVRGGSFRGFATVHDRSRPTNEDAADSQLGFRCVSQ